jgi:gamma-tubulin complex component 2
MFATFTPQLTRSLQSTDSGLLASKGEPPNELDLAKLDKLEAVLKRYDDNFSHHLRILWSALNYFAAAESVALLGLISSLDWIRDWLGTT